MYSEYLAANQNIGWFRSGNDVKYYRNNITYVSLARRQLPTHSCLARIQCYFLLTVSLRLSSIFVNIFIVFCFYRDNAGSHGRALHCSCFSARCYCHMWSEFVNLQKAC